ncbi:MAG TPA: L-glyceraldehyde 3-phosphate reductase [Spirochaetota bacterium]|nr:L-glyceraldehyde 3-phosphate reductase [Spirochaetota bacterium]
MPYTAHDNRYQQMIYRRCGQSGLKLPAVSLGLWHNFGGVDSFANSKKMILRAFDLGITHFDLANNYGPPAGAAENFMGRLLKNELKAYRDELIISTKAGFYMWPGPYGDFGSRKYLIASLDQSLKRMGLDYVDIFYHHRPDPATPLSETMGALAQIVRQGKALYIGISSYSPQQTKDAARVLRNQGIPCLIHQPAYNMFNRWIENGLTEVLSREGIGCIPFVPLAQGLLTDKYLNGIPPASRAAKEHSFLNKKDITADKIKKIKALQDIAAGRGQSLAQMAIAWILRLEQVTSVLTGASKVAQIEDNVAALSSLQFTAEELKAVDNILKDENN